MKVISPLIWRYGFSIFNVASALLLTSLLWPLLDLGPSSLFFAAVVISTWYGGFGPGLLATILSTAALNYFFTPPIYSLTLDLRDVVQMVAVAMVAGLISWLIATHKRAEGLEEQQRLWQELERQAALLQEQAQLLDFAHDAVLVRELGTGAILFWNQGAEEMYGWTKDEALGRNSHALLGTRFLMPLEDIEAELICTGRWQGELIHTRKYGTHVIVMSRWALRRDKHGQPLSHLEISSDRTKSKQTEEALKKAHNMLEIRVQERTQELAQANAILEAEITERKRAEQALRESEERERARAEELTALMEAVPAVVCIAHDPECQIITGSRTAHELLRMPMGANLSKTAPQSEQPIHFRVLKEGVELAPEKLPLQVAARGVEVRDFENEIIFNDRTRLHLYGNAVPLRDRQGRVRGAIGAFIDITERKRFEEALKEADRRKDEFLAMLAHELRNPLAPIHTSLQLIRLQSTDHPTLGQPIEVMERQVKYMVRLLDDLLDISRITRGKIRLQKEPLKLKTHIDRAAEISLPLIEVRKQEFTISLPQEPLYLEADPVRLEQILVNLLNNAAKYTEPGGRIWLTVEREGEEAILRVQDTGIGISPEMLSQIFNPFVQADQSLARSQGGLGIGLTLVRNLVELHRGRVSAYSPGLGQGSTFEVRLPLLTGGFSEKPRSGSEVVRSSRQRHILVVDDNRDTAMILGELLKLWGHEVQVRYDGLGAVEAVLAYQPEVVLLDLGLPGMDGYEVARRLRQETGSPHIVLIALTGYGQEEDQRQSREVGFDYHFVKPINPTLLRRVLSAETSDSG